MRAEKVKLGGWTEVLGTTQPLLNHAARITAPVDGRVVSVLGDSHGPPAAEGQPVQARQVIVQLDDRIPRANRDKLAATLAELTEQQRQAQFAVDLAEVEVKRLEDLSKGQTPGEPVPLVSRIELQKARIGREDALSRQQATLARQAGVKAELKALEVQLDFYTLRSPIAGRLGLIQVMPGQTLHAGTVVADVVDLDEIDVLCHVPPRAAARLKLGDSAELATPKKPLEGKVVFIAVQAQPETGSFAVKVRFPNKEAHLRANAVARVRVLTEPEKERLAIPEDALMEDQEPPTVVVVQDLKTEKHEGKEEKLGKARLLKAVLGVRDRDRHLVEVLRLESTGKGEPVSPGDLLFVTEGQHGLHEGDELKLEGD